MNKEPALVVLNGLAATVGLILVALNITGVTHFDAAQTAALVAAVAGVCNLVALAIRAAVVPVQVNADQVAKALATPAPAPPTGYTVGDVFYPFVSYGTVSNVDDFATGGVIPGPGSEVNGG